MNPTFITLEKSNLFKNKSLDEIKSLLSKILYKIESFKKNEIIFSPTQKADTMGIVLSGSVDIQKLFPSGKVVILARKEKTDLIGEPCLFAKIKYYPSTVSVCKPCEILFLHKNELQKLFLMDETIMQNFLESVSNSMLVLKNKIEILSLHSIQERISCFLMNQFENNHSSTIKLPFSKKAWAEHMNVSRPSLSRELRNLEMDGILSFDMQTIEIKNLKKLKEIYQLF